MGNCIGQQLFSAKENARVFVFNGGEEEFRALTLVKEITSGVYQGYNLVHHAQAFMPLPPKAKVVPGEVYYLASDMMQPSSPTKMDDNDSCRPQSIKIVVTKQQLEFLLRSPTKMDDNDSCRPQSIKIVVTKQQLEFLLRSRKRFQPKVVRYVGKYWGKDRAQKWQPSLAAIPESQNI